MKILVVNAGSSTHKFSLFDLQDETPVEPIWQGSLDWGIKNKPLLIKIETSHGIHVEQELQSREIREGFDILLKSLYQGKSAVIHDLSEIERIGHRVVHGGCEFDKPVQITPKVKERIRELIPLAPLHNRANLEGIVWMESALPSLPQIAVFDTTFHLTMPEWIKTYPIPWEWKTKGVQRYGFHGISHHYCAERAAQFLKRELHDLKIINCHLGNGCSLCAIREGKSYETTMGFTPLEGLMMGSRCGSIDPGILLFLMREHQMSDQALDDALNFASGLKGIAGTSDMRELLDKQGNERALLAVQMFVHRLKGFIGSLAAGIGGCDVLSFTAGIGENSTVIREAACKDLTFLNLVLDNEKNRTCKPDDLISSANSSVQVLVLHTREEWMIARAAFRERL